jgi:hypothetical protein
MSKVIVRYRIKADRIAENVQFVEQVYAELQRNSPAGLRYATFRQSDGVTFIHLASIETESGENPLAQSAAFQAFQVGIKDRCDEPPVAIEIEEVGSYRFFGE